MCVVSFGLIYLTEKPQGGDCGDLEEMVTENNTRLLFDGIPLQRAESHGGGTDCFVREW